MDINLKQSLYSLLFVAHRTGCARSTILRNIIDKCNELKKSCGRSGRKVTPIYRKEVRL